MSSIRRSVVALAALTAAGCAGSSEPLVARVGKLRITRTEFERKLQEVAAGYQHYVLTASGRRQFLEILIREKTILAAALTSEVPESAEFRDEMERMRAEEAARLQEGRDFLLSRLWIESLRRRGLLKAGTDEAREHHRRYPMEASFSHILTGAPEQAEALALKARTGAAFAVLAKAHSLDAATAGDGGRMQPAVYGEIIPDLEDVVFRMKIGEVSGPIKSKLGYHVLRKDGERKLSFEECQDRILRLLEKQKLDRHLESLQAKFPVEVVDDHLR